jgi:hypothetical protein
MFPSNNNVHVRVRHAVITSFLFCLYLACQQVVGQGRDEVGSQQVAPPNDRFHVQTDRDVRVTTAVPTVFETFQIFGVSLYTRNIQPVWVQIENLGDKGLWFLPTGLDEAYFTPIETSYRRQNRIAILDWALTRDYYDMNMSMYIEPGRSRSGYIFTRVDEGTKSFNVDVVNKEEQFRMSFFVPVPGLKLDHYEIVWQDLYAKEEIRDVDLDGLIAGLQALPCCTTDNKAKSEGDPLNLVIVGEIRDAYYAFMRAGWDETETIYGTSLWKTMTSAIGGGEYRYSPVSALYVYGRAQDAALQKARASIHQRNHLRLWMTPMRYEGKPVWIGQISRDIGVRLTWKTITTHKIDPDVDETREYLLEDLAYAQSVAAFGYVGGVGFASYDQPRSNLTGDPYFTDGLRVVLFVSAEPVAIDEIDYLNLGQHPLLVNPE